MEVIENPPMPYWGRIPGGLEVGKTIQISGYANHGAHKFNIDFARGNNREVSEIALHFNPRFDQRVVVRNSYQNGRWENEERAPHTFPFFAGKDFDVLFLVEATHFKVAVNGRHYIEFRHRLPIRTIDKLNIEGNIKIKRIEFNFQNYRPTIPSFVPPPQICPSVITNYPAQPQICPPPPLAIPTTGPFLPTPPATSLQPVYNPAIPFRYPLYNGLKPGMMIYISGRSSVCPSRFNIDLACSGEDRALHFNPRFDQNVVVRNSYINRNWGTEERYGYFPFLPGAHFDIVICTETDKYMIAINGKHFTEYRHRIMPLSRINTLLIEGDVVISCIRFQ